MNTRPRSQAQIKEHINRIKLQDATFASQHPRQPEKEDAPAGQTFMVLVLIVLAMLAGVGGAVFLVLQNTPVR